MIGDTSVLAVDGVALSVDQADLARLLGYPAGRALEGEVLRLAEDARGWYSRRCRPWACTRRLAISTLGGDRLTLADGTCLRSVSLASRCRRGEAVAVVAAGVTAGAEVDTETALRWDSDRPDEAYVLDRFAVAVVEHLAGWAAGVIAQGVAAESLGTLASVSPGYEGWDLDEQRCLAGLLAAGLRDEFPGPLEVLESGMIVPKSSLLAVFPLTPRLDLAAKEAGQSKCNWCAVSPCAFRRARFDRGRETGRDY